MCFLSTIQQAVVMSFLLLPAFLPAFLHVRMPCNFPPPLPSFLASLRFLPLLSLSPTLLLPSCLVPCFVAYPKFHYHVPPFIPFLCAVCFDSLVLTFSSIPFFFCHFDFEKQCGNADVATFSHLPPPYPTLWKMEDLSLTGLFRCSNFWTGLGLVVVVVLWFWFVCFLVCMCVPVFGIFGIFGWWWTVWWAEQTIPPSPSIIQPSCVCFCACL